MVDVRGDVLRPPHGTTPAAVKSNIKSEMRSFKSNENIHKKEGGSYYVVSANKASYKYKHILLQPLQVHVCNGVGPQVLPTLVRPSFY